MVAATDVADLLVGRGCPSAKRTVSSASWCGRPSSGRKLSELSAEEVSAESELLDDEYFEVLERGAWLDSKVSAGGTSAARLGEQLEKARRVLDQLNAAAS